MPDTLSPLNLLLSVDLLPEELHLSDLVPGFLDDIEFKNHVITNESACKHEATHNMTLVFSKTVGFAFPGSDIKLLLNPAENGSQQTSEIDIRVYYKWEIIRFITDFKITNVPSDLDSLLPTITNIYNINSENVLQKLIGLYEQTSDTIQIPIQAIVDEINRFYAFAGTESEISFGIETPSFDLLETKLIAAGKTLADVITDFNLGSVINDPNSAVEVLGAVIKKGVYNLVETLNTQYSLNGVDKIDYNPNLDFSGISTKLSTLGHDAFGIIKDLVVDITSDFKIITDTLFNFLKIGTTGLPTSFKELFIPDVDASATDVNLALEFPRSILIPMDDKDEFLAEPATSKLTFEVGDLAFSTQNGFDFDEVSTCELKQSSIKETGLTIEFTDCVIDFHDDSNIPQADADNRPLAFQGVFIDEAIIKLPKFWQADDSQPTTAIIKGDDLLIGNPDGFTGQLSMSTDVSAPGDLLHFSLAELFKISLNSFDLLFNQNSLDETNIEGTLIIQGLKKPNSSDAAEVDISINITDDIYTIEASEFDPFELAEVAIDISTLKLTIKKGKFDSPSNIDGTLTFPVLNDGSANSNLVPLAFLGEITDTSKKFSVASVPPLKLFGIEIALNAFDIEFDNTQILNANIDGILSFPSLKSASGQASSIALDFIIEENGYKLDATDISRLNLLGLGVDLEDMHIAFNKSGLDEMNLNGDLFIPGFENNAGEEAALGFGFKITENNYLISCGPVPSIFLFGIEFKLNDFDISFTKSQLDDFTLSGAFILPVFTKEGSAANPTFSLSIQDNNYGLNVSNIPPLALLGFELTLEEFGATFNSNGITQFNIDGSLTLPLFMDEDDTVPCELDFQLKIDSSNYRISTADVLPPLHLAGLTIDLDKIDLTFDKTGIGQFALTGKFTFPEVDGQIDFDLEVNDGDYTISASSTNIPPLSLGGMEIKLTSLSISFNRTGITATDISGSIQIPAFDVELEISINFEKNGFSIEAKVPDGAEYIDVLDIEDMINVQLSSLSIGKNGNDWSFGFGGKIINHIAIPGIEKFVPNVIDIQQFALGAADEIDLNIGMEWPNGFKVGNIGQGGSSTVPVNQSFGDIMSIRAIQIDTKVAAKTEISAVLLGTKFNLGPVNCTIEGLGFEAAIEKKTNGNLGPLDVSLGLIYPKGIAIGLDTDVFRGGGYLFFDRDNNRYAGAIELSFQDQFTLSAIGLLTTQMPDGTKGTSLLIIITTKFPSPIPLGYNFNLAGVGGLLGLHRTTNVDKLREGVVTNAIDNILFPSDVINNISQIISDLRELFPPKRDQFLIGPMAMITWSTPALLTIELGLIIEFDDPVRIIILGVIKAGIPNPEDALIKIQVNFIGVIDFDEGMISFDAALFDSRIVSFTLEGSMALRMSWGQNPDFALSVGGFHPAYTPARHLKFFKMKRLTISLMGGNPRLTLTSYFALSTNSVQFGAAIDFYFKVSKFKVIGGFGFDVLFMFNPFSFIAEVRAGLAVKWGSTTLFSISLKFTLTGPSPWIASGTASFKIWFIKYKARFNKTFGEEKRIILPDINVLPLVIEALENSSNWKSEIPDNRFDLIVLRKDEELGEDEIILQTFGTLTVSQKIVPLGINIERFGNNNPIGDKLFEIDDVSLINSAGESPMDTDLVREDFVPSAYKDMKDADKLTAPSFEKMRSGIKAKGTDGMETEWGINRNVEYEVIVSDVHKENGNEAGSDLSSFGVHQLGYYTPPATLFNHFAKGGAVRNSTLSRRIRAKSIINNKKVNLSSGKFVVVTKNNLEIYNGTFLKGTKAEANEALLQAISNDPTQEGKLMTVPEYKTK